MRKKSWRFVLAFRPIRYTLRRNWYGRRVGEFNDRNFWLLDIGAVTIGVSFGY